MVIQGGLYMLGGFSRAEFLKGFAYTRMLLRQVHT